MPRGDLIQFRRGDSSTWTSVNPVLADGEIGLEKDTGQVKIGNGTQDWNTLSYAFGGGSASVVSVNGLSGIVTLDTDNLPEGSTNLYFTNLRATTALTGANISIFTNDVGYLTDASPAGADSQVQFNDGGSFGADSSFTWDNVNKRLGINTATPQAQTHISTSSSSTKGLIVQGAPSQSANLLECQDSSGNFMMGFTAGNNLKIGNFTTGGGVTDEAIITQKIIRAAGGLNLRTPTVNDAGFSGVRLSGNSTVIVNGSQNVLSVANNLTSNTAAATIQRSYNPSTVSGVLANWSSTVTINNSATSTTTYASMWIRDTITQSGSNQSVTIGMLIQPNLISPYDWRSLEIRNNSGKAINVTGTAPSFFNGTINSTKDIEIEDSSKGLILSSPDGTRWRVQVDNSGNLTTTSL
jgi:hypothetical protein